MSDLNEIAKALAAAQAEMQNPGFDSTNPHFRNKFASLAAVRNAVVPVLARHGISMCQDLSTGEGVVSCRTILTHASGQQMAFGPLTLPATKADAQGYGSAATYARRYALMAVAGVVGDEDDDANSATGKPAPAQAYAKAHSPVPDEASDVPKAKVAEVASKILAVIDASVPEDIRGLRALDLLDELNQDQIAYIAGAKSLRSDQRKKWKDACDRGHQVKDKPILGETA